MSQSYHRSVFPIPPQHASAIAKGAEYEFHRRQDGDDLRYVASLLPDVEWFKPLGGVVNTSKTKTLQTTIIKSKPKSSTPFSSGLAFVDESGQAWVSVTYIASGESPEPLNHATDLIRRGNIQCRKFRTCLRGKPQNYTKWPLVDATWEALFAHFNKIAPVIWHGRMYRGLKEAMQPGEDYSSAFHKISHHPTDTCRKFSKSERDDYILKLRNKLRQSITDKVEAELGKTKRIATDHQDATRAG